MRKKITVFPLLFLLLALVGCSNKPISIESCTHNYHASMVLKQATCSESGQVQIVCSICKHEDIYEIPATGNHTIEILSPTSPTCSSNGKTSGTYCTVCGEIIVAPEDIPALPHTEVIDAAISATCSTTGRTEGSHCSVCNKIIKAYTTISKKSHEYGSWSTAKEATCSSNGTKTRTCIVCGYIQTEAISKLEHTPNSSYICTRCGEKCPIELKMTASEIAEAKKVNWISDRQINDLQDTKQFRLMFSLKDSSENYLKVPVIVEIKIKNDNGEIVYNSTKIVKTSDYTVWTNVYGKKWTAAAIYINYSDIYAGTTDSGEITFTVYNDYVSFDPSTLSISNNLPLKSTTVKLPTLPDTIFDYNWDDKIDSSCKITNITYKIDNNMLYLYFSGEKTYDAEGDKYSQACLVGWKLYDSDGYIKASGTFYSPAIAVGEKFRDEKVYVSCVLVPGETYVLKISDVD